ncbi:MAG TPA: IPT/TIG domain-containing protein [Planctomycetota bacterium]|nr:IPT/TIG domain-containing protein [Planctomycetota bacterium]
MRPRALAALAAIVASSGLIGAHVRLHVPSNAKPLYWTNPDSIGIVIQKAGSDDVPDGSHFTALRNAIAAWGADPGTRARLVEDTSPSQQARTDWSSNDIHLILFDEQNGSGYFPSGSATVAITPVWYSTSSGAILDADVLFNGKGFQFTTSGAAGSFDIQDVGTHELGHLLGLDHSGWAGASMYPYVSTGVLLQRSLSLDDVRGLREAYPAQAFASITGTVRRAADQSVVKGAHVVARDQLGRSAAGALADSSGVFRLRGLEAGTYLVYATPLDQPVSAANLSPGHVVQTDFASTYGTSVVVAAGQGTAYGDLMVDGDVALSLGRNSDVLPLGVVAGGSAVLSLHGSGLVNGSSLQPSDPLVSVVPLAWMTSSVVFSVDVPAGAEPGHVDLAVVDPFGGLSILPAAMEVVPPSPAVDQVAPALGAGAGGTFVTLTGSSFNPGARVVIGPRIYADGESGGCLVVDGSTITLTTSTTADGTYDVVVIDSSGVEGRAVDGFTFASIPSLDTVFPPSGQAAGGTEIVLRGKDFVSGLAVRIDGVAQAQVFVDSAKRVRVVTEPGVAGGPYVLEVENPGGAVASAAFSYSPLPDPVLGEVAPASGPAAGGTSVTLTGASFNADCEVWFGANPDTGLGGVPATSLVLLDGSTLAATTPAHGSGTVSVLVRNASTGQASVLKSGYTFASSGGGGGGGCHVAPIDGPRGRREAFLSWLAPLLALALLQARAWRLRRRLVRA